MTSVGSDAVSRLEDNERYVDDDENPPSIPSISCELCKSRKVRCDRRRPVCARCARNGQTCIYKARRKPGLRAGFGKELEGRLSRLEGLLKSQQDVLAHLANRFGNEAVPVSPLHSARASAWQDCSTDGLSLVDATTHDQTVAASRFPPVTPLADGPLSSGQSMHWSNASEVSNDRHDTTGPAVLAQDELPPYELLHALTRLFFTHVYPWFPLLHETTTMQLLSPSAVLEPEDFTLFHAIVVITLRYYKEESLSQQMREQYYRMSKQKVLLNSLDATSVRSLQALVILALDVAGTSNGPPALNLLAMSSRSVVQLGLASEAVPTSFSSVPPSISTLQVNILSTSESFVEEESRRRLFWAVYLLDRLSTVATAFDFALDQSNIHRRLPCHHDFFFCNHSVVTPWFHHDGNDSPTSNKTEYLGTFGHYVGLVGILSKIHLFLREPINIGSRSDVAQWQHEYRKLDGMLRSWQSELPSKYQNVLQSTHSNDAQKIDGPTVLLHMTLHMTTIRLHSSAAYPTNQSQFFKPSSSASQRCLAGVQNIANLCELAKTNTILDTLGPSAAFCIWVAARLLLVHGATVERQIEPSILSLVETLEILGQYWNVADRYATLLRRVLDEFYQSSSPETGENQGGEAAPSVQILADMRRCAYDLDVLISRQPRLQSDPAPITNVMNSDPAQSSMEYLDLFDFFNVPRLPLADESLAVPTGADASRFLGGQGMASNSFHDTNYLFDPNADWLSDHTSTL